MKDEPEGSRQRIPPGAGAVATATWETPRRFAVYRGNILLGTTNLEYPVVAGSRAAGRFQTTPAFTEIAYVFALYHNAAEANNPQLLIEYVRQRDSLRLELWDSGTRLDARVDLISLWSNGQRIVHVTSADKRLWRSRRPS